MTGRIAAGTPWTRDALKLLRDRHPAAVRMIEDAIPAGCHLVLVTTGRPFSYNATVRDDAGEVARSTAGYPTVISACWAALEAARKAALV